MPYIRVSIMKPKAGGEVEVRRILDDLTAYFARQPGYLGGYRIDAHDGTGFLGRITTWTDDAAADRAAQTDHVLAIRSQLNPVVEDGSHEEHAFQGTEVPPAG
jgi:quinol monooxygenase YgiN